MAICPIEIQVGNVFKWLLSDGCCVLVDGRHECPSDEGEGGVKINDASTLNDLRGCLCSI